MLTNEGQPNMIARAKAAGAKGWIVKPVKPELIISALNKLLAG
jgi:two-component system chemotaxis response regulator CheY